MKAATAASPATGAIRVEVPIRTVSEMNVRSHWSERAKRARAHRSSAYWCLAKTQQDAPLPCVVTLTRIGVRALDGDNLQSALKACRDGVADFLRIDDADARVTWRYAQRQGKPYAVEICVEAA